MSPPPPPRLANIPQPQTELLKGQNLTRTKATRSRRNETFHLKNLSCLRIATPRDVMPPLLPFPPHPNPLPTFPTPNSYSRGWWEGGRGEGGNEIVPCHPPHWSEISLPSALRHPEGSSDWRSLRGSFTLRVSAAPDCWRLSDSGVGG